MTEEEFDRNVRELERETTLCVILAVALDAAAVVFLLIAHNQWDGGKGVSTPPALSPAPLHWVVMLLPLIGGPRDGDMVNCCCEPSCNCQTFGHGAPNGNKIMDGYIEVLMYRRTEAGWVPDRIERKTMCSGKGFCPRCNRAMPDDVIYCKNCGAEMDPLGSELSA